MSRVVANLHVVVSMDPSHPRFTVRCESNPALYNKCTVRCMKTSYFLAAAHPGPCIDSLVAPLPLARRVCACV